MYSNSLRCTDCLKSETLELESKLADEGDDLADDEGGPAQAQADEARLADDGATHTRAMELAMAGRDGPGD